MTGGGGSDGDSALDEFFKRAGRAVTAGVWVGGGWKPTVVDCINIMAKSLLPMPLPEDLISESTSSAQKD
jgi:hypothetical protein